jgi:hypothetical protein
MLNFLILGIVVIWCHSFTKLTSVGGKYTAGSLLNFLLYFVPFYLLFYSSYILRRWLRMTRQMTSSTTSSIAPEEARSTVILGTTKHRCLHMCSLWTCMDVILSMDVMLYMHVMKIVTFEWMCWILWCLNECVGYFDVWMNVSDLDVCRDILYIVCANCAGFIIPAVLVILFSTKKIKPRLIYDGWGWAVVD